MPATKNTFRCANGSHKGYGKFCHRCAEGKRLTELANKLANGEPAQFDGRINLEGVVKKPGRVFTAVDHSWLKAQAEHLLGS